MRAVIAAGLACDDLFVEVRASSVGVRSFGSHSADVAF